MTYTERYYSIIHYFQRHPVDKKKIYCERHHIVPASCGGSDKKDNLVDLPAAWHYRVHCYLPFVMKEQNNEHGYRKMIHAWRRCLNSNKEKIDLMRINQECLEYKILREADSKLHSIRSKKYRKENPINGDKNPMFNAHWWKDPNDKTKSMVIKEGDEIPNGWIRGHWNNDSKEIRKRCAKTKGMISITDGKRNTLINPTDKIPEGWHRGQTKIISEDFRKILRKNIQKLTSNQNGENNPVFGSIWINNGIISKLLKRGCPIPDGWQKGRLPWIKQKS